MGNKKSQHETVKRFTEHEMFKNGLSELGISERSFNGYKIAVQSALAEQMLEWIAEREKTAKRKNRELKSDLRDHLAGLINGKPVPETFQDFTDTVKIRVTVDGKTFSVVERETGSTGRKSGTVVDVEYNGKTYTFDSFADICRRHPIRNGKTENQLKSEFPYKYKSGKTADRFTLAINGNSPARVVKRAFDDYPELGTWNERERETETETEPESK
jgi:hypothetical protein